MNAIGFTGSFGSGCSTIIKKYVEKLGYQYISLSRALRTEYAQVKKQDIINRTNLQDFGDELRKNNKTSYLAELACSGLKTNNYVIDSIRNPGEIEYLKDKFPNFFLIGVYADKNVRWDRVFDKYEGNYTQFNQDDIRDANGHSDYGQNVTECYLKSDIIIANNEKITPDNQADKLMKAKIMKYLDLIEGKEKFKPNEEEALMVIAFANSLRSRCLKRKVGAVVVDLYGNIFSSGYNEVPYSTLACIDEHGKCYRDVLKQNFKDKTKDILKNAQCEEIVNKTFIENFKIMDYCRSLHAEENAIVNISRFGSSNVLNNSTLYTTTYPCNLCANKIVQIGISKVIYLEPYPMEEAKNILATNEIKTKPFEGVLFNGYFRFKN